MITALVVAYFSIALLCFGGYMGFGGYEVGRGKEDADELFSMIPLILMISVLWIVPIVVGILSSPYWIGKMAGKAKIEKEKELEKMRKDKKATIIGLRDAFKDTEAEWKLLNNMANSV